jgi:hypothetical protein
MLPGNCYLSKFEEVYKSYISAGMLLFNVVLLFLPFTSQITRRTADFSSLQWQPGVGH